MNREWNGIEILRDIICNLLLGYTNRSIKKEEVVFLLLVYTNNILKKTTTKNK